jgi:ribosomal protein S18 acetylase RimI-like enzyme
VVEMIIRKAKLKDLKSIAEIFWVESSKPPYNKKRTLQKVIGIIKSDFKGSDIYVAITDNKTIGFITVQRDSGIKDKLWINEIWILKEFQGRGIGKKLDSEIERIYKKKGIKRFELVAHTERGGALSFYKKLNYKADKSMIFLQKKLR